MPFNLLILNLMPRFALLLLFALLLAPSAYAVDGDAKYYHRAFAAIEANNAPQAEDFINRGRDPILNKVLRGYAMGLPNNDYTFEQLDGFISTNPGWPGLKGIQMIAEQKIPPNASTTQIINWFTAHEPVTLVGFYRYVDALNQAGQAQTAIAMVQSRWINGDFSGDEQTAFYGRFAGMLDANVMWARMDRLLWKNDVAEAQRMLPYVSANDKIVAQARLSLASQDRNAEIWLSHISSDAQNDPGLLFQRLRWYVKNNHDEDANDILLHPPSDLGNPSAWWEQRQIMIRRAMERHDNALAYNLCALHAQTDPKNLVQGEFLCGWLALRFLDKPDLARQHFQSLYDNASTPVSRARGAYWLGRSYEALGDKNAAEQAYEDAAAFDTAYYGQLATVRLYTQPVLTAKSDPPLPESARRAFQSRDILRAIVRLNDIDEDQRARSFFHAAADAATERAEFIILTEIAAHMHRPDLGIMAVKAANQKNMLVQNGGFPLITMHVPTPPEAAFTHALIRQESLFNPDAESGVGARGLMQLMPGTAKDVARKLGVRYSQSRLLEPAYNLQLGTTFVQDQIDRFDGSYILALAGYNAGSKRVQDWIAEFGDPRSPNVDPIDWIELIPIQETRNYVQRIIENLQIYRAKLAGGKAPLLIINDLKR